MKIIESKGMVNDLPDGMEVAVVNLEIEDGGDMPLFGVIGGNASVAGCPFTGEISPIFTLNMSDSPL